MMTEVRRGRVSNLPTKEELYNPILTAFRELGRSASPQEIESRVINNLGLPDDVLDELTPGGWPRLRVRLDWARFDLKNAGLLDSTQRGVWVLTEMGEGDDELPPNVILRISEEVMKERKRAKKTEEPSQNEDLDTGPGGEDSAWRGQLKRILLSMDSFEFERLCVNLLRESGFSDPYGTAKSRDGGIDGRGLLKLHGMVSIPVAFQCKRYAGSVSADDVQRLRGALRGEEKGLFFTTGTFTEPARREAREGKHVIDLIDGDALMDKLEEFGLGVVQRTTVDTSWWESNYGVSLSDALDADTE